MCVTSNLLVMFSSFEIFDVISYEVVFIIILLILYAFCRSVKLGVENKNLILFPLIYNNTLL